jgi:hypothetical protein
MGRIDINKLDAQIRAEARKGFFEKGSVRLGRMRLFPSHAAVLQERRRIVGDERVNHVAAEAVGEQCTIKILHEADLSADLSDARAGEAWRRVPRENCRKPVLRLAQGLPAARQEAADRAEDDKRDGDIHFVVADACRARPCRA